MNDTFDGTNHRNERHPETESTEVVVKTQGNKSLRLNVTRRSGHAWEVTLPFRQPVILVLTSGKWSAQPNEDIDPEFACEIGAGIEAAGLLL